MTTTDADRHFRRFQATGEPEHLARMFDELAVHTPERLWITDLSTNAGRIKLVGNSLDNGVVADFLRGLNASDYFDNVDLLKTGRGQSVNGVRLVRFENPQALDRLAQGLYDAAGQEPLPVESPDIQQGKVEGSNVAGVVEMVARVKQVIDREILLVMGGFHLLSEFESNIRDIAMRLKELGVRHVAPSHCSGGEAIAVLAEVFGDRFIKSGIGRVVTAKDLS